VRQKNGRGPGGMRWIDREKGDGGMSSGNKREIGNGGRSALAEIFLIFQSGIFINFEEKINNGKIYM